MRIAVTGALGFIGSNLCLRLRETEHDIFGIDNQSFGSIYNMDTRADDNWEYANDDFNNLSPEFLENFFDVLIHTATSNIIFSQDNEIETFRNNAINTIKLFQKFKGKIVYTSTASVYNNATVIPTPETYPVHTVNAYDSSKLIAELFIEERGNYTTLRLENVYGVNQRPENPYCGVVSKMIDKALHNEPIEIIGNGEQTRTFTYVDDVVDAIIKSCEQEAKNDHINISSQHEISINSLAATIQNLFGKRIYAAKHLPERKIDGISRRCLSNAKAKHLLGWSPQTSLEEGIKKTIAWIKTTYEE